MTFKLPGSETLLDRATTRSGRASALPGSGRPSTYNVLRASEGENPWETDEERGHAASTSTTASDLVADADEVQALPPGHYGATFQPDGTIVEDSTGQVGIDPAMRAAEAALVAASETPTVCDVCSAAKLAEEGVMPTSVPAEELHTRCRAPGTCACGCEVSTWHRCSNCKRPRPSDSLQGGSPPYLECVDREGCAKAMLDAAPAAKPASRSQKATSTARGPAKTPSGEPRVRAAKVQGRPCTCTCGETTSGGLYKPGHDSRHVKALVTAVKVGGLTREAAAGQLPSDALKEKLVKQLGG